LSAFVEKGRQIYFLFAPLPAVSKVNISMFNIPSPKISPFNFIIKAHNASKSHNACDNLCKYQEKDNKIVYTIDGWKESALLGIA
jgi:hypothetical protein